MKSCRWGANPRAAFPWSPASLLIYLIPRMSNDGSINWCAPSGWCDLTDRLELGKTPTESPQN